jgi:hypothetical protein
VCPSPRRFDKILVSHEIRAKVFTEIVVLLNGMAAIGNRFVITSRPAAVRFLQIPAQLKVLSLLGLSESEIRLLATRVVTAEAVNGGDSVRFRELDSRDTTTVERLLRDCRANPSIAKLASNPRLLTLLALIYVNGGMLAARRHRIYEQAVQTLVSVRNRIVGQSALSETDLRQRLGEVALCLFAPESNQSGSLQKMLQRLATVMGTTDSSAAETYLQLMAERTGLLMLDDFEGSLRSVSFMHYSFLEYYAAVGLVAAQSDDSLALHATSPAWRDVLEVVCGIRSDKDDVSPLLAKMAATQDQLTLLK